MLTALASKQTNPVIFVQIGFATGYVYLWSGIGSINWNGQTWLGVGKMGKVSPIADTATGQAKGLTLELSGIPSDLISDVLAEVQAQYKAYLWWGLFDSNGNVIANPEQRWAGMTDVVKIQEGGTTSAIQITVESKLVDLGRARERHWTHQDQQIDYPGDNGFLYVNGVQELDVIWGQSGNAINNLPSLGGQSGSGAPGSGSGGGSGSPNPPGGPPYGPP
jgi:hypothetical protein